MMRKIQLLIPILILTCLSSCKFISNTFQFKNTTQNFIEALIDKDYDGCMKLFALEHAMAHVNVDTIMAGLPELRKSIVNNFGEELEYSLMGAKKVFSTVEEDNTPPKTTFVHVQLSNNEIFGVLELLFDDVSGKILNINTLSIKEKIPNMLPFWLFGLLAICVPIFNIYVINQIRKSNLKRKMLKYFSVVFLNVPAVVYTGVGGLGFKLLTFQILLGISFNYMGYLNAMWAFGIPLGGLYWFWRLKIRKEEPVSNVLFDESLLDNLRVTDDE